MLSTKTKDLKFPELPYQYSALEPYIDAMTMEIHYTKHHKTYYDKFIAAVKGTDSEQLIFRDMLTSMSKFAAVVRNNGGGYLNHDFFWKIMSKNGGGQPEGDLAKAITDAFGSFENFKNLFSDAAANRFGSGWAWLIVDSSKNLKVTSTPNQDNPMMDVAEVKGIPILGLDVWEHAYYLKYQNRRPEYINAFWNVINWEEVDKNWKNAQ
ncbi:MAG TPA: superoxide dismutase [Bacteroidales bacterium]|nr:superoxide dismutase [Bacteroidales bacterium]HPR57017.1 superoxide dismutase [Bacteroidales bacterium]